MTTQYNNTARYDTFKGLIPCKVIDMQNNSQNMTIKITRTKGAYKAGDILEVIESVVLPVKSLCVRNGQHRIKGYKWFIGENGINAIIQPFTYSR